jgi:hypothetical protein
MEHIESIILASKLLNIFLKPKERSDMDIEEIINFYAESARQYGDLMDQGEFNQAIPYFDQNEKAFRILLRIGKHGAFALLNLLGHEDPHVRISAATHLINTYRQQALEVLEALATETGFQAFNAQVVLDDLKKGNIAIPAFNP